MLKNRLILLMLWLALLQTEPIRAGFFLAAITGEEAILAAEQYTGKGKILGTTQVMSEDGHIIYRVKILMPSGVLRTVVVDAETGGVVE